MKNSFNAFCLLMLVGAFALLGVYQSSGSQKPQKQSFDTIQTVKKIHEINNVVKTELLLDSTTFGVCDTCRSSFVSALQENRTLVDSVLDENLVLYDNWIATKSLNDSLLKVNKMVLLEIKKSWAILKKR